MVQQCSVAGGLAVVWALFNAFVQTEWQCFSRGVCWHQLPFLSVPGCVCVQCVTVGCVQRVHVVVVEEVLWQGWGGTAPAAACSF
jgi:hypothetical protein